MLPIGADELLSIQNDAVDAACDKTCEIYRKTRTPDGMGSSTETYNLIETTVAGMAQPSSTELANYDYAIGDKAAWTVRLPIGTDAIAQDHLLIEGNTLEVNILLDPKSYEIFHSVIATEIK